MKTMQNRLAVVEASALLSIGDDLENAARQRRRIISQGYRTCSNQRLSCTTHYEPWPDDVEAKLRNNWG